jgi:sensor histidine kinase YesM
LAGNYKTGILCGTISDGVYEADLTNIQNISLKKIDIINSGQINQIYYADNDWWISSNEGLILLQKTFFNTLVFENNNKTAINDLMIQSICQSYDSTLYFVTATNIYQLDKKNKWIANSILGKEFHNFSPLRAVANPQGLWISDIESKIYLYNLNNSSMEQIWKTEIGIFTTSMECDANDSIWTTQNAPGKSLVFKVSQNLMAKYSDVPIFVTVVKKDKNGNLYAAGGSQNFGTNYLLKYNYEKNEFEDVSLHTDTRFFVNDICFDNQNAIWLATDMGLYKQSNDILEKIELNGIYKDIRINSIASSDDGSIWFANSYGLSRYKNNKCVLYNKSNGLIANTIQPRNLFVDNENYLWVGTAKGVAYLKVDNSENLKTPVPKILTLKVNNKQLLLNDSVSLNFDYNSYLEIEYKSLIYPSSEVIYQTRIINLDENWSEATTNTSIFIPDLKDGSYELQIIAQKLGANYDWSEPLVFKFTILQAWYKKWWAILIFSFIVTLLIFLIVKIYNRKLLKENENLEKIIKSRTSEIIKQKDEIETQKKEMAQKVEQRTEELTLANTKLLKLEKESIQSQFEMLKQQVNPHFLFNSLNVLISLIKIDQDLAEKFTEQLSKVYRYVLENKEKEMVSLQTELNFLDAYMFLLNIRFKDKLEFNINISIDKYEKLILPLALQLLIENSIKHNVFSKKSPLKIDIFSDENDFLNVINNLQIRETNFASTGIGLKNIINRYKLITLKEPVFEKTENQFIAKIPLL